MSKVKYQAASADLSVFGKLSNLFGVSSWEAAKAEKNSEIAEADKW